MHDLPYAKRELVLDLVECIKMRNENDIEGLKSFVPYTQRRANLISHIDPNWRNHKVRAKCYTGFLGDLYDSFSEYHSDLFIKV